MWFDIAGELGRYVNARENRMILEKTLTKEQIYQAKTWALMCLETDYKDCD